MNENNFKKVTHDSLCNVWERIDKIIDDDLNNIVDNDLEIIYLRSILKETEKLIYWRSNEIKDEHIEDERKKYNYNEITKALDKLSQ